MESLCRGWTSGDLDLRKDRRELVDPYRAEVVLPAYDALLREVAGRVATGDAS